MIRLDGFMIFNGITVTLDGSDVKAMNSPPGENTMDWTLLFVELFMTLHGGLSFKASPVVHNWIVPSSQATAIIDPLGENSAECITSKVKFERVETHSPVTSDQMRTVLSNDVETSKVDKGLTHKLLTSSVCPTKRFISLISGI